MMSRIRRDDRGAAMVEFAIVLPVLLLILLGIIEFGRAYHTQVSLQNAAREGARELALRHDAHDIDVATDTGVSSAITIDRIVTVTACPTTGDGMAKLRVEEDFEFMFLPIPDKTLTATGAMRCGL